MSYGPAPGQPPPPGGGWGAPPPPPGGPPPPPPPPGPAAGPGGYEQPANQGNAIGALIANIVGLFCCCGGTIPGLVLSIIGLVMVNSNPKVSRGCTLAAWIIFGVTMLLGVAYAMLIFFGDWSAPGYYDYYDTNYYDTTY